MSSRNWLVPPPPNAEVLHSQLSLGAGAQKCPHAFAADILLIELSPQPPFLKRKLLLTFVPSVSDDYTCANRKQWWIPNGSNFESGKETILWEWQKEQSQRIPKGWSLQTIFCLKDAFIVFFLVCACVLVHVYVGAGILLHVCTCMWMPEVGVRCLSQWLFLLHLTYWSRISLWNQRLPIPASLASQLALGSPSLPPVDWDHRQTAASTWRSHGCWGSDLLSSSFCSKCLLDEPSLSPP